MPMPSAPRIVPGLLLALSACFVDPGTSTPTQADDSSGPATTAGPTATTTADPTAPTTGSASATASTTVSTSTDPSSPTLPTTATDDGTSSSSLTTGGPDDTGPQTTDPMCVQAGGACDVNDDCCGCLECTDDKCVADDDECEACNACGDDGHCSPASAGSPCDDPANDCGGLAFGLQGATCYRADEQSASCNEDGACVAACGAKGLPLFTCDAACLLPDHNCFAGVPVDEIALDTVCATSGATDGCASQCGNNDVSIDHYQCQPDGTCDLEITQPCEPYICDPGVGACTTDCFTSPCAPGYLCVGGTCE